MNVVAIVNPAAGRGGAAKSWESVRAHISQPVRTLETKRRGHATELTASAIREGAKIIVAIGGDGTINEVVNGFFDREQPLSESAVLGIFPYGTGSDLQRTLQLPAEPGAAARLIQDRKSRPIDDRPRFFFVAMTAAIRGDESAGWNQDSDTLSAP